MPATHNPQLRLWQERRSVESQSSILFHATSLRQPRLNDSERKEKGSGCAFPCAFSCQCGMQLSCDVHFRVCVACATHVAPRRSKPQTHKQLQTKRARTEVCAGAETRGIRAVLCSCECGMQLSCDVRFPVLVACATRFAEKEKETEKKRVPIPTHTQFVRLTWILGLGTLSLSLSL